MKLERLHIATFLGVAVLAWSVVLWVQGTDVTWEHGRPFSVVVTALVLLGLAFEHVLWRLPLLHGWFVKRPNIGGTWRVEFQSNYIDPRTQERAPLIVCYMGIKQTLSTLQMQLMTHESKSFFIADQIRPSPSGEGYQIIGVYTNEPNVHLRDARISEMHQGSIILETHGPAARPTSLTGKYWTDRKTAGTMELGRHVKRTLTRFEDAEKALSNQGEWAAPAGAG